MKKKIDWDKAFPITSVCREDLVIAGFNKKKVAKIDDQDMSCLASKMGDSYIDSRFWEDLEFWVNDICGLRLKK